MSSDEEQRKQDHIELVDGILKTDMPKQRWCQKFGHFTHIKNLKLPEYSCWSCQHYIVNGGICDPI